MNQKLAQNGPALAMLLLDDIPTGVRALDALLKEAPVDLIGSGTIQRGLYLVLVSGEVEAVDRSVRRAQDVSAGHVIDSVLLPDAEPRILPAVRHRVIRWPAPGDTLGVLQTATPPDLLRAVDRALKGTAVELLEMRVGDGLGGRAIASFWGETPDIEAAMALASASAGTDRPAGISTSIIRNADAALVAGLGLPSTFFKEWRG